MSAQVMSAEETWLVAFLMLGGALVGLVGLVWGKIGDLLQLFGIETNPELGFKVAWAGLAMLGFGIGLVYLAQQR
jgi:hypothetical protein